MVMLTINGLLLGSYYGCLQWVNSGKAPDPFVHGFRVFQKYGKICFWCMIIFIIIYWIAEIILLSWVFHGAGGVMA